MFATVAAALLTSLGTAAEPSLGPISATSTVVHHVLEEPGAPSLTALTAALRARDRALQAGAVINARLLTLIDYTRPSLEPRMWVIDLLDGQILYRELVAHGRASGDNMATQFSNADGTHMSSLGLFVTDESYVGRNGYSLRLRGLDAGVNDNALARAIVIHGAEYVSGAIGRQLGRLGRSWGCPAVRGAIARPLIDAIKGGSVLYVHGRNAGAPMTVRS